MNGMQLLASCVMSFFVPGLGQMYQATYDVNRRDIAVKMIAAAGIFLILSLGLIGLVFMFFLWLYSLVDCVLYSFNSGSVPAPGARTVVAVLLLVACFGGVTYAQDGAIHLSETAHDEQGFWDYDQKTNTWSRIFPDENGVSGIKLTWHPNGLPADDCQCKCTKDKHCGSRLCKKGPDCKRCPCCKCDPRAAACSTSGSCCSIDGCEPGSCCNASAKSGRTKPVRRWLFGRRGCRSCR